MRAIRPFPPPFAINWSIAAGVQLAIDQGAGARAL
jgi:hypothetical protein